LGVAAVGEPMPLHVLHRVQLAASGDRGEISKGTSVLPAPPSVAAEPTRSTAVAFATLYFRLDSSKKNFFSPFFFYKMFFGGSPKRGSFCG
jgi:hypothetical protein